MTKLSNNDEKYMALTLELAAKGLYTTHPNPRVGCLIVKDDEIVGEGWHKQTGQPHAEAEALRDAGQDAKGSTVYVNLEPCCHQGRTPPCTISLINAGVKKVVVSMQDPNPKVSGKGIKHLRDSGIEVEVGALYDQAVRLNEGFVHRMTYNRPFVRLKVAASIDGRTALSSGESQWISSKRSRKDVHHWRARSSAILTGSGTVIADDPSLTVRHVDTERQPLRVIVSSNFSIPSGSKLFNEPGNVLVATSENKMPPELIENKRLEVLALPNVNKQVNLQSLMEELSKREINELMVEAGPTLSGAMIANGLVDELLVYLAPTILGDKARSMFDLPLLENLSESIKLSIRDLCLTGDDMRVQLLFTKN